LASLLSLVLPETLGFQDQDNEIFADGCDNHLQQISYPPGDDTLKNDFRQHAKDALSTVTEAFQILFGDWRMIVLIGSFLVFKLFVESNRLLLQYVSKRYGWSFAKVAYIYSGRSGTSMVVLLILLPILGHYLAKKGFRAKEKDLWMARYSILMEFIGLLIEGFAPQASMMITGMVIGTLGIGSSLVIRSIGTSLVERHHIGSLYGAISIAESAGTMIAGPLLAGLFSGGMSLGRTWIGLPYFFCALLNAFIAIGLWLFRFREGEEESEDSGVWTAEAEGTRRSSGNGAN